MMTIPSCLLDTSWSIQYIPSTEPLPSLHRLLSQPSNDASTTRTLRELSDECGEYLSIRRTTYVDELNDETEKTGSLRECTVDLIGLLDGDTAFGLSIETQYQRLTYRVILVASATLDTVGCPVSALLYKASPSHLKAVKNWLAGKFELVWAVPLHFSSTVLPRVCSEFVMGLAEAWDGGVEEIGEGPLRLAVLRQVVGTLKITFTFSSGGTGAGVGVAPNLRSMEFDVPGETVGVLLGRVKGRKVGDAFLEELAGLLHEKTGLRLPLTGRGPGCIGDAGGNGDTLGSPQMVSEPEPEPPLKISKIVCAAFALRADGAVKLAGKPIADAEVVGYDGDMVRTRYMELLRGVLVEAERRQREG